MTRTIHIGQVTDEEREIYALVLAANKALIAKAIAGMTYSDFDGIPRQLITEAGYGSHFTHGIGHGIGLDIHENPFLGNLSNFSKLEWWSQTSQVSIWITNMVSVSKTTWLSQKLVVKS